MAPLSFHLLARRGLRSTEAPGIKEFQNSHELIERPPTKQKGSGRIALIPLISLEAASGLEPERSGFAGRCLPVGYATISRPSKNLTRSLNEASPTSFREPLQASAISPATKSCCSLEVSTWGFVPGNAERFEALSGNPSSPHVKLEVQTTPRTIHISSGCPDRVEGLFPPRCPP